MRTIRRDDLLKILFILSFNHWLSLLVLLLHLPNEAWSFFVSGRERTATPLLLEDWPGLESAHEDESAISDVSSVELTGFSYK